MTEDDLQSPDASGADVPDAAEVGMPDVPTFDRPPRRPLVPSWTPLAAVGAVLAIAAIVVVSILISRSGAATVPDVLTLDKDEALARLAQAHLTGEIGETRFDLAPAGSVIEQNPAAGTKVDRNSRVAIVVSAGSEQVTMPDVVGESLALAKSRLESLGLIVDVEYAEDTTHAKDIVLFTSPIQNAVLKTSDHVLLTVAAPPNSTPTLMPFLMNGVHVVLDSAPVPVGTTDLPLRISTRLQSLLEASGAEVTVTRTNASTDTSVDARALLAKESTGAVLAIGFSADETGPGGMTINVLTTKATSPFRQSAEALANDAVRLLAEEGRTVTASTSKTDPVLGALPLAAVSIRLGSLSAEEDAPLFRDPASSDRIAERLYRAIGERYGTAQ